MKKLCILGLSVLLLTACNESKEIPSESNITHENISSEIAFEFKVNENGIDVVNTNTNEVLQSIKGDYLEALSKFEDIGKKPEDFIVYEDFDFDGYKDLFIPTTIGTPNIPGVYYKYNAFSGVFQNWNELTEIGMLMSVKESTLECSITGSAVDHENIVYEWNRNRLKKVSSEVQYASGSEVFIDTLEYDERQREKFIKREQLIVSDDGSYEKTEVEIDSFYKFEIEGNNVNLMRNGEVIQTLECDYPPDENKIIFCDYDFDSYDDLFISTENGALYAQGTYFRYNSDTRLYEKSEQLNTIAREMTVDEENQQLYWVSRYGEEYKFEKFVYEWKYGELQLVKRIVSYEDEGGMWTKTYSVKNADEEILEMQEKEVYGENGEKRCLNFEDIYFRSDENGINVMILGQSEPIQHIEGDFKERLSEYKYAPEYYITEYRTDFDLDGFEDLFIPEDMISYNNTGTYYRFNPQTFQFEYWDAFNELGVYMYPINDSSDIYEDCEVYYFLQFFSNENYESVASEMFYYKLMNQKLILFEHKIGYEKDRKFFWDIYSVDENGQETLTESKYIIKPIDNFY